jgi:tRNA (mo5U34)-methyltransferase
VLDATGWHALSATLQENWRSHGDLPRWIDAIAALPDLPRTVPVIDTCIRIGEPAVCTRTARAALRAALLRLLPWRKGPFELFGVTIDAEWRSDQKWARIAPHIGALTGQRILDVGCGNGYYGWRMHAAGATLIVGIDPSILFNLQHAAICRYVAGDPHNCVLPLRLEDLPATASGDFDTVFSMGVLYHRRDPAMHLAQLRRQLRPDGRLVLETLIVDDAADDVLLPHGRYARMRNVWAVPTPRRLLHWVDLAGFDDARIVDVTPTMTGEQRRTEWMPFESLTDALDPRDASRTSEGHPAPVRAVIVAQRGSETRSQVAVPGNMP